ncbi:MAG TPA: hypothetical protein VNZ26_21695 [Vicinamibacterales bacterium]|jgi:hypothetical protein|nr:hypothetical protein [Vicinamibacterales bacterium]
MTPFDRRWHRLAASARRAPGAPLPSDIDRLLPRTVSPREDWILPTRLGWGAATSLFACVLSLPWMDNVLPTPRDLVTTVTRARADMAMTLPAFPKPPRLPPPPTLPDVYTLVQTLTSKESVR